jgi:hypothetical protein
MYLAISEQRHDRAHDPRLAAGFDPIADRKRLLTPQVTRRHHLVATPDLWDVLNGKGNKYGKPAGPFGLNPYNAVGAALTSAIPGYVFDPDAYAQSLSGVDTCPLDHHGNVIPPT